MKQMFVLIGQGADIKLLQAIAEHARQSHSTPTGT